MNPGRWLKTLSLFLTLIILFILLPEPLKAETQDGSAENNAFLQNYDRNNSYWNYYLKYAKKSRPEVEIKLAAQDVLRLSDSALQMPEYEGRADIVQMDSSDAWVEWEIEVPETGIYNMTLDYFPLEGQSREVVTELYIDGALPFNSARSFTFARAWKDAAAIGMDNRQNEIRPRQVEQPMWMHASFRDSEGKINAPCFFYLEKGRHTIKLQSAGAGFVLDSLKLLQIEEARPYSEVYETYKTKGAKEPGDFLLKIQAEKTWLKSDPTLHPLSDRTSCFNEPYHYSKIRLNTLGNANWRFPGQWVSWKVEVPEDGLYQISMRFKQDFLRGFYTTRKIYVDGQIMFKEMESIKFPYHTDWQMKTLGDDKPYLFYLTRGEHELKMEVTMGDMAETFKNVEECVYRMNDIYRKIIMITGVTPDIYRDYYLEKEIPDLIPRLKEVSAVLKSETKRLEVLTGKKGTEAALMERTCEQLDSLAEYPETISQRLDSYKTNVSSLAAWILKVSEQPLTLDYLLVTSPGAKLPRVNPNVFEWGANEFKSFFASFFEDYNTIGNVSNESRAITVWIGSGRDQANVVKGMIDDLFTPQTGVEVNLNLVQVGLVQAILSGSGPDVALGVGRGEPVNLAVRGALADLSTFDGYNEITKRFQKSASVPYAFDGGFYALPETQTFHMLFYRRDVFHELGIQPPQTWEEFYDIMPIIQRNNMEIGIPYQVITADDLIYQGMGAQSLFPALIFQRGGSFYNEKQDSTDLHRPEAVAAFKEWTSFYTQYSFPTFYDFYNRFRTGEMPMGIQHYTLYNFLSVAAPEIRNLWAMTPIPGVKKPDGSIDRSEGASGSACIMLEKTRDKEAAWEFLKWWTSADVQARYGRELETIMGPAARYNTANLEAFGKIPWPRDIAASIREQWEFIREIPEIPGGYYTSRNIDNAFRDVVFNNRNPRESLDDWNKETNGEIRRKRLEFNLN